MGTDADGAVTWNGDLCVGCRYCQIACPFGVPRFEWDTPAPELRKCELCPDRRARGEEPVCVEACRRGALTFGTREAMLEEARNRVAAGPDRYEERIYGEVDGGGTSVLHLLPRGTSPASLGLPELGSVSVPTLPETLQHTIYKGFAAPLALLGAFGVAVRRSTRSIRSAEAAVHDHAHSEPVGGRILTLPFLWLMALAVVGLAALVWRFSAGLGPTTNLSDGYPMGLWIAFDVVTGTALACGGYALALLVYVANRGRYHPLVRAAIVTSALGYTLGGISVLIDIGRSWNFYKIPLYVWEWNFNSILLEVAVCIMLYTTVLWIEVSPAILERWARSGTPSRLQRFAAAVSPGLERAMPYLIAVGLVLPTMHQSSLGSLMLMAGQKLHPLWHTPLLPLLFLVSCVGMGYAVVTVESTLSSRIFRRPSELPMLRALAGPMAGVLLAYAGLRLLDVGLQGEWALVARMDGYSLLFLAELALFVAPAAAYLLHRRRAGARFLALTGGAVILGGALYRFSTYLLAFDPGPQWSYVPALPEVAVTVGLVAAEVMAYIVLVKRFPILRGVAPDPGHGSGTAAGGGAPSDAPRRTSGGRRGWAGAAVAAGLLLAGAGCDEGPYQPPRPSAPELSRPVPSGLAPAESQPPGDLQCLTRREEDCLEEPVPADEPHGADCATCHDLWAQGGPEGAVVSCTAAGCHETPYLDAPFHASVDEALRADCVACHDPHDARRSGGARDCVACHEEGGAEAEMAADLWLRRSARWVVSPDARFEHARHAEATECTDCHASGLGHGVVFRTTRRSDCRACHHEAEPATEEACRSCHVHDELRVPVRTVERTLAMEAGGLDQPRRRLPFDHSVHDDESCLECHEPGPSRSASTADCSACHEDHHDPSRACVQCHEQPVASAHTVEAHLGCGGSGCHEGAEPSVIVAPRSRQLCLACHQDRQDHEEGKTCAECHRLPEPRLPAGPP
jgi:Ni/Fe-hydrogenase subunit HybB-like protein